MLAGRAGRQSLDLLCRCRPVPVNGGRHAHDSRHAHGSTHKDSHSTEPGAGEEHFSRGFYLALAAAPAAYLMYQLIAIKPKDGGHWFTRSVNSYSNYRQTWEERNSLHTKLVEQAAADRLLFYDTPPTTNRDLRFTDFFNTGSPYNVPAGHGSANLDHLIEHYERLQREEQEKKMRALLKESSGQ